MGGRNGMTLAEYAALSDLQIVAVLSVEWDANGEDGITLVSEWSRSGRAPAGSIRAAGRELPKPEDVGLDDEMLTLALSLKSFISVGYCVMFFSVFKRRGLTFDETFRRWREHLASDN